MKTLCAVAIIATVVAAFSTGCATRCIQGPNGTTCTAKSLQRFDGTPPTTQPVERAPGTPITIDVQYGNVLVTRSTSDKVEVSFRPFCYAGFDEQASAQQQLGTNLRTSAAVEGGVKVIVARAGGTNGLGADVVVGLPDGFDGVLSVVNRGDGPVNNFGLRIDHVGRATALSVTNQAQLGDCWIQGGPTVKSTTVVCAESISLFDVSDHVDVSNLDDSYDARLSAVTLRMAAISPGSRGGEVTTASGSVVASFPAAGGYVIDARSPVKGAVQEGTVPPVCQVQAASPSAKTVRCGTGPTYQIVAGANPGALARETLSDVVLSYR